MPDTSHGPRKYYPIKTQKKQAQTKPPKVHDIKYYIEYTDQNDDSGWDPEKILFSFTFSAPDNDKRSAPQTFLIETENLETGATESFTQDYNKNYYRFWQRQDQLNEESVQDSIINQRVIITPINDFGEGAKSTFWLPFKDLLFTRTKEKQETFSILNNNWHLYSETPNERLDRPKIMYLYLDVPESDIELDREMLSTEDYYFDCLSYFNNINDKTYRWSIQLDGKQRRLSKNGWQDSSIEQQKFITDLIQSMLPMYRKFLTEQVLEVNSNHMFKMAIENPEDNRDSIIIYLMKGQKWEM